MSTFTASSGTVRFTDTDGPVSFTATTGAVTFTAAYQSVTGSGGGGASDLDDLTDVTITAAASGDILRHNGTSWVDTPGITHFAAASTTPVMCDLAVATSATNGSATSFDIVLPDPGADASGVVPAGWRSVATLGSVAAFQAALSSSGLTNPVMLVVSTPGVYTVAAADLGTTAWTSLTPSDGVSVYAGGSSSHTRCWFDNGTLRYLSAAEVFKGNAAGLDAGLDNVDSIIENHEGVLDTEHWCVAWYESNVTVASYLATPTVLGSQPTPTGGTVVLGGDVLLIGQSTTSQNGIYSIDASTGAWTKIEYPDVLIGNSFTVMINADGDADDGTHFEWVDDDVTIVKRRSYAYPGSSDTFDDGRNGRWIKYTAAGGSGGTVDVVSNVAQDRILGRTASGSGNSEELTAANVKTFLGISATAETLLDDASTAAMRTTLGVAPPGRLTVTGQYTASTTIASATSGLTNNRLYYVPILVPRDTTFTRLGVNQVATGSAGASSVGKFGVYNNTSDLPAASFDLPAGTIDLTTGTGLKYVSGSWALTAGIWWVAFVAQITSGSPTFGTAAPAIVVSSSDTTHNGVKFEGSVSGSLPSTATPGAANTTSPPIIYLYA
jgi:hypothetical protein